VNRLIHHIVLILIATGLTIPAVQSEALSGAQLYDIACEACHSLESAPDHRVGPPLGNLLDRKAATIEGYRYSEALRASEWTWTLPTLLAWLSDPDTAIPNNAMNYVNALTAEESQQLAEWLLQQP
jgi:cytochrome c